ncbi:MAG: response regulator [Saprospiraceae bacterium]|nr:response regulator [Saprospiraceae bacterium]
MANSLQILIVDGDSAHTRILEHLLNDGKGAFKTFSANTMDKAFVVLQDKAIDLCLLDLFLPGEKEYQILGVFRKKFPEVPVIAISHKNNEVLFQQSIKGGAYNFLIKGEIDQSTIRRSIQIALQFSGKQTQLLREKKIQTRFSKIIETVETISGIGHFTLQIVSSAMTWSGSLFDILGLPRNSVPTPSLSTYLEYVHFSDKAAVSNLILVASEDRVSHSLVHRIVVEGRRTIRVNMTIKAKTLNSENVVILGSLQNLSLIEKSVEKGSLNQNPILNISFPLERVLDHHRKLRSLFRVLEKFQNIGPVKELLTNLKLENEAQFELFYRIVKENLAEFAEPNLLPKTTDFPMLTEQMENYFWMRATNAGYQVNPSIPSGGISEIVTNQLVFLIIFVSWIDMIFFDLRKSTSLSPNLTGEVEEQPEGTHVLKLRIIGLERPISNEVVLSSERQEEHESLRNANRHILDYATANNFCTVHSTFSETQILNEHLHIPIKPVQSKNKTRDLNDKHPIRILLAEDHVLNQINFKKLLEEMVPNMELDLVSNGREAVDVATKKRNLHLILLDLHMPLMGGIDAAKQIRALTNVPIVVLASHPNHQEVQAAKKLGIIDFLEKPLKKRALKLLLEKILE